MGSAVEQEENRYELVTNPISGVTNTEFRTELTGLQGATHVLDGFGDPIRLTILSRTISGGNFIRPSVIILSSNNGFYQNEEEPIEMFYNDGEVINFSNRTCPNSDGTWILYNSIKENL